MKGLIDKKLKGEKGEALKAGRMGDITVRDGGLMIMGEPFVFNSENIDQWSQVF
jgi:rhamnose transport system substrate-binding protein